MIRQAVLTSLVLFLDFIACDSTQNNEKLVTIFTTSGKVKGKMSLVSNKHEVLTFLSIPFAEPPINDNRFKKPIAVKPWKGILDATQKPTACMQITTKDFKWVARQKLSEDCLYLNIWVPKKFCNLNNRNTTKSFHLPIMIWLHSGGFWSGSSTLDIYDGSYLAAYGNVIVASMNYRVGAFGFLYSGTSDAPGNMGLHDQVLAMKWIKENAKNFCGDPNRITLFGNSAGSVSVGLHLISPYSRNLFTRAIMQSGSPYHPSAALDLNIIKLKDSHFAISLGCANETVNFITDPKSVVDCLKNLKAEDIIKVESILLERIPYFFIPISGDDFLPKSPLIAMDSKDFKRAEILIGNAKTEGTIFLNYMMPELFDKQSIPDLHLNQAKKVIEMMFQQNQMPSAQEVANFYLGNKSTEDPKLIFKAIHESFGDFLFVCPSIFFAEKAAKENDVYYYLYTHRASHNAWGNWTEVGHFEEVPFVFGEPLKPESHYTVAECKFSYNLIHKWTSFARTGKPISTADDMWPKYSRGHQYQELNPKNQRIGENLHIEACNFWKKYFQST